MANDFNTTLQALLGLQLAKLKQQRQQQVQNQTDTISNVGNPIVNVNVTNTAGTPNSNLTEPSAFRAVNTSTEQIVPADTPVKVIFPTEQFDLANEYDPATSTFIPKTTGVYSISGEIGFFPDDPNLNYRTRIEIRVNGTQIIAIDNDFFGGGLAFGNVVTVSTIYQLNEGDQVEVFAQSNISGTIIVSEDGSRFEAARFPS